MEMDCGFDVSLGLQSVVANPMLENGGGSTAPTLFPANGGPYPHGFLLPPFDHFEKVIFPELLQLDPGQEPIRRGRSYISS
jgi:hypothetical protein